MNKALVIVGCAVLAAAMTTSVTTAQAGKHNGGGFRIGGGHHFHHRHHHRRHIIVTPVYTEKVVRKPVIQEKIVVVRYEDGMGRVYDLASKVWHDGASRCWSGKLPWTFKNGAWSYGNYRWSEASGNWGTNAPVAPAEVDCGSVPAFAGKFAPTVTQSSGQKELIGSPAKPLAPTVKTAEKRPGDPAKVALPTDGAVGKPGDCKKYVPSLGEMLPVPCNL